MSVNLEMSYAKKVGLPEYSSHNFSVSLKTEVARLEDVSGEVERVYRLLQTAVDEQIVSPGFVPGKDQPAHPCNSSIDETQPWRCSDKQRALIVKIVDEGKLDRVEVEQLAVTRFGHGVALLNKLEASGLIDELLGKAGRPSGRQTGTVRAFPQRRAA